jgi:hypothetical protein
MRLNFRRSVIDCDLYDRNQAPSKKRNIMNLSGRVCVCGGGGGGRGEGGHNTKQRTAKTVGGKQQHSRRRGLPDIPEHRVKTRQLKRVEEADAEAHKVKSGLSDEFPNKRGVLWRLQRQEAGFVFGNKGGIRSIARKLQRNGGFVHVDFRGDPVKV